METRVEVKTIGDKYDVIIGEGLDYGALLRKVKQPCTAVIISDDNVFPLYGDEVTHSLAAQGFKVLNFIIKNGEGSKTLENFGNILDFLAKQHITRTDLLVALGGGVVGDLTGFVASVYLRRIDYVQIPTTLLAAVDSSVGGKTGVNLSEGKNLVGAFYQPCLVLVCTQMFKTLPQNVFSDGMAEVIKYAIIKDKYLFDKLFDDNINIIDIVRRCVLIKAQIVGEDEFDTGQRQLLNFGHTIGHAIEALSDFTISHGSAVSIGMVKMTYLAQNYGLCSQPFEDTLCTLLNRFGLPTDCDYPQNTIAEKMLSDKKRGNDTLTLIVPQEIGSARLYPIPITQVEAFIGGYYDCNN